MVAVRKGLAGIVWNSGFMDKWTKVDDMMYHRIKWGSRGFVRNKVSELSFQFSLSIFQCLRLAHNPKKALQTKVNEIKGRDRRSNTNKTR